MEHNWVIIGSGNVAQHLIKVFALNKIPFKVASRSTDKLKNIQEVYAFEYVDIATLKNANCIIAVSDDAIEEVAAQLDQSNCWAHTSGAASSFKNHPNAGVFYPLQTFKPEIDIEWEKVPIYIEATNDVWCEQLYDLAQLLSDKVAILEGEQRLKLHLAAVFACNFPMYLQSCAEELMKEAQLDFKSLFPLMDQTLDNVKSQNVFKKLTGPAVRGDEATISKHLKLLEERRHPDYKNIYENLTYFIKKHKNEL